MKFTHAKHVTIGKWLASSSAHWLRFCQAWTLCHPLRILETQNILAVLWWLIWTSDYDVNHTLPWFVSTETTETCFSCFYIGLKSLFSLSASLWTLLPRSGVVQSSPTSVLLMLTHLLCCSTALWLTSCEMPCASSSWTWLTRCQWHALTDPVLAPTISPDFPKFPLGVLHPQVENQGWVPTELKLANRHILKFYLKIFILYYSWFAMLCLFQVYNKVILIIRIHVSVF